jgi:hypothetical protein
VDTGGEVLGAAAHEFGAPDGHDGGRPVEHCAPEPASSVMGLGERYAVEVLALRQGGQDPLLSVRTAARPRWWRLALRWAICCASAWLLEVTHAALASLQPVVAQPCHPIGPLKAPTLTSPNPMPRSPATRSTPPFGSGTDHPTHPSSSLRRRDALRARREREAEWATFGVPTDRPPRPGMDHASAQPSDLLERGLHVRDGEVRERGRVARTGTTFVNAERRTPAVGLPAATFGVATLGEIDAEQARPEPKRAIGIISRELD